MPKRERANQSLTIYLLLDYLKKHTDEENPVLLKDINEFFSESYGFELEHHRMQYLVDELNIALYMTDNEASKEDATEWLANAPEEEKYIVKVRRKGVYLNKYLGDIQLSDYQLLVESLYASRFIDEANTKNLVNTLICSQISEYEKESICHTIPMLSGVRKTRNRGTYTNIEKINRAIESKCKVSFAYSDFDRYNPEKQKERTQGRIYIESPYRLLINDSNYYMVCYHESEKADDFIRSYRVDRVTKLYVLDKESKKGEQPRDGEGIMKHFDLDNYFYSTFGMFGGEEKQVELCVHSKIFSAMVDRFGSDKKMVQYAPIDEEHTKVSVKIRISHQFFGWLLGFGDLVKIIKPYDVIDEFKKYIETIRGTYD